MPRTEHKLSETKYVRDCGRQFAEDFLAWRKKSGLNPREVALQIKCHAQAIRNVEECRNFPSWSLYVMMCRVMGRSLA